MIRIESMDIVIKTLLMIEIRIRLIPSARKRVRILGFCARYSSNCQNPIILSNTRHGEKSSMKRSAARKYAARTRKAERKEPLKETISQLKENCLLGGEFRGCERKRLITGIIASTIRGEL